MPGDTFIIDHNAAPPELPDGEYGVICTEIEIGQGEKGPYLNIRMDVCEGAHEGAALFDIVSLSDKSQWKAAQFAHAFGVKGEGRTSHTISEFMGRGARVRGATRDWKRRDGGVGRRFEVDNYLSASSNGETQAAESPAETAGAGTASQPAPTERKAASV